MAKSKEDLDEEFEDDEDEMETAEKKSKAPVQSESDKPQLTGTEIIAMAKDHLVRAVQLLNLI